MSKKLRIGIIGAGRIGKLHANNLVSRVKDAELVAVSDVYEPAAKDLAEKAILHSGSKVCPVSAEQLSELRAQIRAANG